MSSLLSESETAIRKRAARLGYRIKKSRTSHINGHDHGEYMLVDTQQNCVVMGSNFDAALEVIDVWLRDLRRVVLPLLAFVCLVALTVCASAMTFAKKPANATLVHKATYCTTNCSGFGNMRTCNTTCF